MRRTTIRVAGSLLVVIGVALPTGCGHESPSAPSSHGTGVTATSSEGPTGTPTQTPSSTPTATADLGTVPPAWLGKRVLPRTKDGYGEIRPTPPALRNRRFTLPDTLPPLPGTGFKATVERAPRQVLARSTWAPGCPVRATDLSWVRLTFWGFDNRRHTGELLVNKAAADPLVTVFRTLYREKYPIEEMRITRKDEQDVPPTGDGNDTGAFNCRPTRGATSYSQHAYGLAIDVNPFINPYTKGDVVLPERASAYLDRARIRPGMIEPGDAVVRAFAAIGWEWGGNFRSLMDLQHFSRNGT